MILARATMWLFGATVLAALLLRLAVGDALHLTRYAGYVLPWLLAGLVPGAVWAWMARFRALSVVLGASAAAIVVLDAPLFRARPERPPAAGATLRVMSFNTWSRNWDDRRIAAAVLAERPDLLLLQEIPPTVFQRVLGRLRATESADAVHAAYVPCMMQGVVSRYPLERAGWLEHKGQAQRVVVRTPTGPVTVYNVHPLRSGGWRHRYLQIAALLEEDVLRERGPVILAGDLNAPEHSELYALLARHLRNAHREAGWGFGFTYPSPSVRWAGLVPLPPLVRVDHVFVSPDLVALRAGTLEDSAGSDHRPVFAELALPAARPDGSPDAAAARIAPARGALERQAR